MIDVALQLLVIGMMLSIGLELQIRDVLSALRRVRWVAGALALNLVFVPAAVWFIVEQSGVSAGMATGLILLAASPAGPIGPALSRLSAADLGFSTGLMVLLGVCGLVTTPLSIHLLVDSTGNPAAGNGGGIAVPMFVALLLSQIVPLVIAMGAAARWPERSAQVAAILRPMSNVLLIGIVVALLVVRGEVLTETSLLVHLGLAGALAIVVAPVLRVADRGSVVRSMLTVTAVRNMSIALFLASRFYTDPAVEAAILIWSLWMLVVPAAIGGVAGRYRTVRSANVPLANGVAGSFVEEVETA